MKKYLLIVSTLFFSISVIRPANEDIKLALMNNANPPITISKDTAQQSGLIKSMLEEAEEDEEALIPLDAQSMGINLNQVEKLLQKSKDPEILAEYLKNLPDSNALAKHLNAANYLDIANFQKALSSVVLENPELLVHTATQETIPQDINRSIAKTVGAQTLFSFLAQRLSESPLITLSEPVLAQNPIALSGHTNVIKTLSWSPDSRYITSGSTDQTFRIWDRENQSQIGPTNKTHKATLFSAAWNPDISLPYIATLGWDFKLNLWKFDEKNLASPLSLAFSYTFPSKTLPVQAEWSSKGQHLAIAISSPNKLYFFNLNNLNNTKEHVLPQNLTLEVIKWSPNGKILALGSSGNDKSQITFFDPINLKSIIPGFPSYRSNTYISVDWKSNQAQIASSQNNNILLWNTTIHTLFSRLHNNLDQDLEDTNIYSLAWHPYHPNLIATGLKDGRVRLWDSQQTTQELQTVNPDLDRATTALAWSPNGRYLAAGFENGSLLVWELPWGNNISTLVDQLLSFLTVQQLQLLEKIYVHSLSTSQPLQLTEQETKDFESIENYTTLKNAAGTAFTISSKALQELLAPLVKKSLTLEQPSQEEA